MIIDFHTHTFPDKIAAETIKLLAAKGNTTPHREGTLSSLKASMKKAGIDYSVVLPVATSPKQVQSINRRSAQENGKDGVFFAGAIHPDCENIGEILDFVKSSGLFGIKIHPDYQGVYFDDERYIRIMREAAARDLITVTHAGVDIGYPDDVHCTPQMVLNVLERLSGLIDGKLVLAHMGGYNFPDEVEKKLVGKPVYFDTAYVLDQYPEKCREIIETHGFDKILFATDSPWCDQKKFVDLLRSFGYDERENERMFYRNAERLLKNSCDHLYL